MYTFTIPAMMKHAKSSQKKVRSSVFILLPSFVNRPQTTGTNTIHTKLMKLCRLCATICNTTQTPGYGGRSAKPFRFRVPAT